MPADPELDAVIVAAPDARRVPTPIEALETGRHVLCEKPAGVSRGAAAKLGLPVPVVGNALDEVRALAFARDPARAIPGARLVEAAASKARDANAPSPTCAAR